MDKRRFLQTTAAATLLTLPAGSVLAQAQSKRPLNVLFMTADDMNWSMPGFMGGKGDLMPNLDRLAAASHRFVNNRCAAPICQPAREAMFSGLMPHRSGGGGFTPLREGTPTVASILHDQGYFTAGIHKLEHMQPPTSFPWDFHIPGKDRNPLVYEQGVRDAIAQAKAAGKPFYINCNINDPHRPFYGSPEAAKVDNNQEGPYKVPREITPEEVVVPPTLEDLPDIRKELAQYWNSNQRLDITIGKVLGALRDSGEYGNTLIVFSSDHGMPFPFSKATCYDYGTRVPFVISWPGMGAPRTFENLTCNIDVMPTLLDMLDMPKPAGLDGRSLVPIIEGRTRDHRPFVFTEVNTVASGVAYPMRVIQDHQYALVFSPWADGKLALKVDGMAGLSYNAMAEAAKTDPRVAARVKQYIYGVPYAFYDLKADPGQRLNLAHAAEHQGRIAKMRDLMLENMARGADPQLANFKTYLAGGQPTVPQDPEKFKVLQASDG
jgi:N-sulfoglucosamine sulfohydrolase